MRVVDILPVQLGVAMYPEHEKVKSLLIDEIESHGDDYEHKKIDAVTKSLEHLDYYSPLSNDKYKEFREWIELQEYFIVFPVVLKVIYLHTLVHHQVH